MPQVSCLDPGVFKEPMYLTNVPDLNKANSKRCTIWLAPEHKAYIEDLAYSSQCRQIDVLHYIIETYKAEHPVNPIKSRS